MTDITLEQRARELLAAEYERDGSTFVADCIRHDAEVVTVERRALRAIEAALRLAVPEGMVMVPREPTREMVNAARTSDHWPSLLSGEAQAIYCAMLAAAPTVSAEGGR